VNELDALRAELARVTAERDQIALNLDGMLLVAGHEKVVPHCPDAECGWCDAAATARARATTPAWYLTPAARAVLDAAEAWLDNGDVETLHVAAWGYRAEREKGASRG
jgi:hypothetical protein